MSSQLVRVRKFYPVQPERRRLPFLDPDSGFLVTDTAAVASWAADQPQLSAVPLFMMDSVYRSIVRFCQEWPRTEVGGALLGRYCVDQRDVGWRRFLVVEHAFPLSVGPWCSRTEVNFPAEFFWELDSHLCELRARDPGLLRLGLYHSHPGFGVFLSGTDKETLSSNFAEDWQVSLILDPVGGDEGVFYRRDRGFSPPGPLSLLRPREESRLEGREPGRLRGDVRAQESSQNARATGVRNPLWDENSSIRICGTIDPGSPTTPVVLISRSSLAAAEAHLVCPEPGGPQGLLVGEWIDERTCVAEVVLDRLQVSSHVVVGSIGVGGPADWAPEEPGLVLHLPRSERSSLRPFRWFQEQRSAPPRYRLGYVAAGGRSVETLPGFIVFDSENEASHPTDGPQGRLSRSPVKRGLPTRRSARARPSEPDLAAEALEPDPDDRDIQPLAEGSRSTDTLNHEPGGQPATNPSDSSPPALAPDRPETPASPAAHALRATHPDVDYIVAGEETIKNSVVGAQDFRQAFDEVRLLLPSPLLEPLQRGATVFGGIDLVATRALDGIHRSIHLTAQLLLAIRVRGTIDGSEAVRLLGEHLRKHGRGEQLPRALVLWRSGPTGSTRDDPHFRMEAAREASARFEQTLGEAWLFLTSSGCFTYRWATVYSSQQWSDRAPQQDGALLLAAGGRQTR